MRNIEIIKYTGEYPNFCSGVLYFKVDDKQHQSKIDLNARTCNNDECEICMYCRGCKGKWYVMNTYDLTKDEVKHLNGLLDKLAGRGCCGGCI